MMDHDEMFSYVLAKCEKRQQQRKRRTRIVRQAVLVGMCLAVVIGAGVRNRLGSIETAPEKPPAPETTVVTATETAVSTTAATVTTQRTTTTAAVTSSQKQTETSAVTTAAPTQQTTAAPTTHASETTVVAATAVTTEHSVIVTTPVPPETRSIQMTTAAPVPAVTEPAPESTAETAAQDTQPTAPFHVIGDPETPEGTAPKATEPVLPELPGFDVTWDAEKPKLWHIGLPEAVTPSPEENRFYTVNAAEYRVQSVQNENGDGFIAMYAIFRQDAAEQYSVMQYRRDEFSIVCTPFRDAESGQIGGYPCIWGKEHGKMILFWDDGCYTFKMTAYNSNRALAQSVAEAFVQAE